MDVKIMEIQHLGNLLNIMKNLWSLHARLKKGLPVV